MHLSRTLSAPLGATLLLATLPALAPPASAAARPDLVVSKLSAAQATASPGGSVTVTATTANVGRAKAGASRTRFYLSTDRARSSGDVVLGTHKVSALARDARSKVTTMLGVPTATAQRAWYVVACADATSAVREAKEGNNCRATPEPLQVEAGVFPMEPDPLSVGASTLEETSSVTKVAGLDGPTTLVATADDGTTYTLRVPADALLSEQEIVMTPVSGVAGLPLEGGLLAGVQLEPHGLMLQAPARLVIDSPDLGPLDAQTPFVFHDDGEDLHAYPVAEPAAADDASVVRMQLSHFSTAGVGSGTSADRAGLASHPPARPASQLAASLAELTRGERESQEGGDPADPDVPVQVLSQLEAYADQVVGPALDAAMGNPDLAPGAVAEAAALARQISLLDEANPRVQALMTKILNLLKSLVEPYWQRCLQHDLRAVPLLIGLARQLALLGAEVHADAAFQKALSCARYEIELTSTVGASWNKTSSSVDQSYTSSFTVEGTALSGIAESGVGTLSYSDAAFTGQTTFKGDGCPCTINQTLTGTQPGSMLAEVLERANPIDPGPGGGSPQPPTPYVEVVLGRGADGVQALPTEMMHLSSQFGENDTTTNYWLNDMVSLHNSYLPRLEEVLDLAIRPDGRMLAKTYEQQQGDGTNVPALSEFTELTVWHRPKKDG